MNHQLTDQEMQSLQRALTIAADHYAEQSKKWARTRATPILKGRDIARCRQVMDESGERVLELMNRINQARCVTITCDDEGGEA